MDVAFFHVRESPACANKLIASVRAVMPHSRIVQMSDETTPALDVDLVLRKPCNGRLMTLRLEHLADFEHERAMFVDTDVLVKRDPSVVFADEFDVALTRRDMRISSPDGHDIGRKFPYNTGVMFSRSQGFWRECARFLREHEDESYQRWWGDQLAVVNVADSGAFRVRNLDFRLWNWSPIWKEERSVAYLLHFKGPLRKEWM